MSDMIITGRPSHLWSTDVLAEVESAFGQREISDAAALTIASWWQSPGDGLAFATLASTGQVSAQDLFDDLGTAYSQATLPQDRRCLDMLGTWAINHPSRA